MKPLNSRNLLRLLYLFLLVLAIVAGAWRLPAYASRLPWLLLLAISDFYLYQKIAGVMPRNTAMKILMQISVGLPSALVIIFFSSMALITPLDWHPVLRTYWLGAAIILYILRIFPLIAFLKLDIHKILVNKTVLQKYTGTYRSFIKLSVWMSAAMGVVLVLGTIFWVYDIEVNKVDVRLKKLPPAFENYRIVQISDLHLGRVFPEKRLKEAISTINSLNPDMIVFTGDLVNYATSEAYPNVEFLSMLSAPDGIFAVLGNHDYGDYLRWPDAESKEQNIREMETMLAKCNWTLLRNENRKIIRDTSHIFISGIDHWSPHRRFPVRYDLDKAMDGIPSNDITILLAHDPVFWQKKLLNSQYDIDVTLSGHTHAFQVGLKCGSNNYSPPALIKKHWKGLYTQTGSSGQTKKLYVNAGLGHIMYPGRIGMKPEITLIRLIQGD